MIILKHDKNYLELQYSALIHSRVFENIEIERSTQICLVSFVPNEASNTNLKSVHPSAVVHQLLISVLDSVIIMLSVIIPHI